jgi:hypothetical protein
MEEIPTTTIFRNLLLKIATWTERGHLKLCRGAVDKYYVKEKLRKYPVVYMTITKHTLNRLMKEYPEIHKAQVRKILEGG